MKKAIVVMSILIVVIVILQFRNVNLKSQLHKADNEKEKLEIKLKVLDAKIELKTKRLNYYRSKFENHKLKLDSIYQKALTDSDEEVLQFFKNRF